MLLEAVIGKTATHLHDPEKPEGQKVLDDSVAVSSKKARVDGSWNWDCPSDPGAEIPVASAALAHWGAKTSKRKPGRKMTVGGMT